MKIHLKLVKLKPWSFVLIRYMKAAKLLLDGGSDYDIKGTYIIPGDSKHSSVSHMNIMLITIKGGKVLGCNHPIKTNGYRFKIELN